MPDSIACILSWRQLLARHFPADGASPVAGQHVWTTAAANLGRLHDISKTATLAKQLQDMPETYTQVAEASAVPLRIPTATDVNKAM